MSRIATTALTLALIAGPSATAEEHRHPAAPPVADPRFDFLKRLEGTWVGVSGPEDMAGGVFEFRVTAGGSAIEEREMVGTPKEMVTVYHMRGQELVGTHYCMLGNQPRVKAARSLVDDTLVFACDGKPGNARSHDDPHVHGWSMRLAGDGTLHYSAELVENGKVTKAPSLVLTRKTEAARR